MRSHVVTQTTLCGGCFFMCLFFFVAIPTSYAAAGNRAIEVLSQTKILAKIGRVDFIGKDLRLTSGTKFIDVCLTVTCNRSKIKESVEGKIREKELILWRYELTAKNKNIPYSRYVWTFRPVKGVKLFPSVNGKNYLAWVDGSAVYFEEVSESFGTAESLVRYLKKTDRYLVPVTNIAGRAPFEGLDAIHSDIDIISVENNKYGSLQLAVKSPKTGERYEFIFKGMEWILVTK